MSHPAITYEDAAKLIGVLPTLEPRPTATNIRSLVVNLVDKLITVPSQQTADHGYAGMVEQNELYTLRTNTPWVPFPDPGEHATVDPAATDDANRQALIVYNANKKVYDSESNVKRAVIQALNTSVPRPYKRAGGQQIGAHVYRPTDCPKAIIGDLRTRYGTWKPAEKTAMQLKWNTPWNPNETIEQFFDRLEDCYVMALSNPPPYTLEQMIDQAKTSVQQMGLYTLALLEWNDFEEASQTWSQFKQHFTQAYDVRLVTCGTEGAQYHGAAQATVEEDLSVVTQSFAAMQHANNANTSTINDNMTAMRDEVTTLRQALVSTQQQLALIAHQGPPQQAPTLPCAWQVRPPAPAAPPPVVYAPTVDAYVPPPAMPAGFQQAAYAAIPPPAYGAANGAAPPPAYGGRGGRGYQGRGYRGGRGARGSGSGYRARNRAAFGTQPPAPGGATSYQGQEYKPNPVKRFNNWNMCFSCGWDVPAWHTSKTCPTE